MATLTSQLIVALVDRVTGPSRAIAASVDRLTQAQALNTQRMNAARMQMLDAAVVAYAMARAFSAPVRSATEFETKLEDIGQKINATVDELPAIGEGVRAVARETTQSAMAIAEGMDVLTGMGANRDDALNLLGPIGRAATAYNASITDLAQAGYAALDNLKVPAEKFGTALDAMATAGKAGAFELKDMARYFPELGAGYAALGQTGVPAVADLAAALQVVRKGTGDSASAATNLTNILQKMRAPQTVKAFKKMGVNLEKELAAAAAKGMTPIEAIAEITNKALKGDLSRLGYLFSDAQVQQGLRPILQNLEEYRRIRAEAMAAQGTVEEDYQRRLQTGALATRRWRIAMEDLGLAVGIALLPALTDLANSIVPIVNKMAEWADANPALTRAIVGTAAALVGLRVAAIAAKFSLLWMKGGVLSAAILGMRGLGAAVNAVAMPLMARRAAIAAAALLKQRQAAYTSALAMQALASKGALAGLSMQQATKNVAAAGRAMAEASAGMKAANAGLGSIGIAGRAVAFVPAMLSPLVGILGGIATAIAAVSAPVWGVIAVVVAAVAGLALAIYNYWVPISEFVSGFVSVIWDALSGVASAIGSFGAEIASAVGSWAVGRVIDAAALLGIDEAAVRAAIDGVASTVTSAGTAIVAAVKAIPGMVGDWLGDIFTMNTYSAQAEAEFRSAGQRAGRALVDAIRSAVKGIAALGGEMLAAGASLAQSLWDGVQVKVGEMVAWFSGLPGRILAAIGRIDIGSLIKWPTPPAWLSRLWGGGGDAAEASAPAVEKRAGGGPVRPGEPYLVGERGPELVTFGQSGIVHDALKTARMMRNAALASTMALPAAAMPAMPQAPRIDLAGLHAAASAAPATAGGRTMNISDGAVQITIHASPGQSPEQIAAAVERSLSARLGALSRGAFSDGAN